MTDTVRSSHTDCGLDRIGPIPYGAHICNFYRKRQDLIDSVIPWFQAGLEAGEHCIWITAAPLPAEEARTALMEVMPSFTQVEREGRIVIMEAGDWYTEKDVVSVVTHWLKEEEEALARGCSGLRIASNASFLKREDWAEFLKYEAVLDKLIKDRRIVAQCSYSLQQARASDIFEVTSSHRQTLTRFGLKWDLFEP